MSKDVKLKRNKKNIAAIMVVILLNISYVVNAFATIEKNDIDYTVNVEADDSEILLLDYINQEREKEGLLPLKLDSRLMELAKLKTNDMLIENYVSHNSDKYGNVFNMLKTQGIKYSIAGENIARNQTVERAVKAWMNSESHRDNILEERYEYTGISILKDDDYGYLYVQIFM